VDDLTLAQANALLDYWYEHPPLQLMVQRALQIEATRPRAAHLTTSDELRELAGLFGQQ
jgi:hypothetical protein